MSNEKPRLLLVDDNPDNLMVLHGLLKENYRTILATNGEDALTLCQKEQLPQLILLDVMMPGMDGYEVCRQLKQLPATRRIPVIFVTARDSAYDEEFGLNLGAMDYISKPYSILVTKARIRNHIRLKKQSDLLEELSHVDALTQIPNRRSFDEALDIEWKRAFRERQALSMMMIDIDHFKEFNDHYGHGSGDEALRKVASVLASGIFRPADRVARYGGEEFVVLLPDTRGDVAARMADSLRENVLRLAIPHEYSSAGPHLSISIGCASLVPSRESSPEQLLETADKMLYRSKHEGRNRVSLDQ